jgi:hypothetical protein
MFNIYLIDIFGARFEQSSRTPIELLTYNLTGWRSWILKKNLSQNIAGNELM